LGNIIQDSQGNLILIYSANIGVDTNNSAEAWAVAFGMRLAEHNVLKQLVVEGVLQLIINLIKKLMTKSQTQNLQIHWRLSSSTRRIENSLGSSEHLKFQHVRRRENKVANLLENLGAEGPVGRVCFAARWEVFSNETLKCKIQDELQRYQQDFVSIGNPHSPARVIGRLQCYGKY
jgi:hypothetical protein